MKHNIHSLAGEFAIAYGEAVLEDGTRIDLKNTPVFVSGGNFVSSNIVFYNKKKLIQNSQIKTSDLYPLDQLYPFELYIKEPDFEHENDQEIPHATEICSYYARRGSHWVKYHITESSMHFYFKDPERLPSFIDKNFDDDETSPITGQLIKLYYFSKTLNLEF